MRLEDCRNENTCARHGVAAQDFGGRGAYGYDARNPPPPVESRMLQEDFLHALVEGRVPVTIYLVNGIRLQGEIESHEQYGLLLRGISQQFVYKHAISTILPSRDVAGSDRAVEEPAVTERRATTLRPRKPRPP
jgi:host factor-I protein